MKHVKKSILLWYSPREIYDLVVDVPSYPQFLPWCQKAELLERQPLEGGGEQVSARLHLAYGGVRHAFTTRNINRPGESVTMALLDGPFSSLEGAWRFSPIGTPAASTPGAGAQACRIEFDLAYAFSSKPLELVVSPVFDRIANTFVDAFVARAEQVHGRR